MVWQQWGKHSIVNLFNCCPKAIRSPNTIRLFNDCLVKKIDMVAYGPPQIVHFGSGNKAGYTLVQLIETSNIMGHFVEETNDAYLDIFSCKEYCPKTVEEVVREYFKPEAIQMTTIKRKAGPYDSLFN